jgi:adenine deaminase
MRTEERALLESVREHDDVERLTARKRLEAGSTVIAERFHNIVGPLKVAAVADLVITENDTSRIRHVLVDGCPAVENGLLLRGDIDTIRNEARNEAEQLWERMKRL